MALLSVVVVVLLLTVVALWGSRVHTLNRRVGSFPCSVGRTPDGPWSSGVAQYGADRLYWWRYRSLAARPHSRWQRDGFVVVERTEHQAGQLVVTCRDGAAAHQVHLLMSADAYAGLTSWIEATPSRVGSVI
ncbi:DUF2550 domain-containing protein [Cellulomonas sp. zg-ZUI188]|uniref:DUF2550 domain-containing protein n=1 Tax=Cellulomonas fengjieae TaxID=2819978 RepID=A0ABS3SKT7_9CELL|nr:DUF2550 domain-containing protein [Cellulomonas fengjieae]MBO3100355.1 DUF2550 domain-containing protein [Cellulomonas fengjieae]QVI67799.1 DUF2550 domain-containing protein [Cellulomonas fengjieae]